jgi:hypothetical protein
LYPLFGFIATRRIGILVAPEYKFHRKDVMAKSQISTLNEKPLHDALKRWYAQAGDRLEVPVDGSIVDIVRGELLIEIQTGNFSAIRRKLEKLLKNHPVRLVYPIAKEKWIVRLSDDGITPTSRRRSPKRGAYEHVFGELVRLPELVKNANFSIEILLIEEEETRRYDGIRGWRRGGWVIEEHRLRRVVERRTLASPEDFGNFISSDLPEPFSVTELAAAAGYPRRLAQKAIYCLRLMGCLDPAGKRGKAVLYTRRSNRSGQR